MKKTIYTFAIAILFLACKKNTTEIPQQQSMEQEKSMNKNTFQTSTLNEELISVEGKPIRFEDVLNQNKGKKTVIEVWASWCPDCIKALPELEKLQQNYPDVNYIFVSLDKTEADWHHALEKYNIKGNHYFINQKMKDSFGSSINLDWIPRYILVDENSNIIVEKAIIPNDENLISNLK